jgi:hypothetical protein
MSKHLAVVTVAVLLSAPAFAEAKTKEEAQAEVDKGKIKSCEVVKQSMGNKVNAPHCADELSKVKAIDCAAPRSYKIDEVLGLNSACLAKVRAAAGSGASASGGTASTGGTRESRCKVLDADGKVVLEDKDTSTVNCQKKVKETLAKKCDPSTRKLQFQFVGEVLGKETRPTKMTVYCPRS